MEERWFTAKILSNKTFIWWLRKTKASRMLVVFWCANLVIERFSVECAKALVLHNDAFWLAEDTHATFLTNQKQKCRTQHRRVFPRIGAWHQLHVLASSSDWFLCSSSRIVIGQSNNWLWLNLTLKSVKFEDFQPNNQLSSPFLADISRLKRFHTS